MLKIALNGFGRIGRSIFKECLRVEQLESLKNDCNVSSVGNEEGCGGETSRFVIPVIEAINDPFLDTNTIVHMMKYDSVFDRLLPDDEDIQILEKNIIFLPRSQRRIHVYHQSDVGRLPWSSLDIDVVCDCSGSYTTRERAGAHLAAGARRVVITTNSSDAPCMIIGANEKDPGSNRTNEVFEKTRVIATGCDITQCVAPFLVQLTKAFEVQHVCLTIIHPATSVQKAIDGSIAGSKNMRGERGVLGNIVPGVQPNSAEEQLIQLLPDFAGKLSIRSYYVPTSIVLAADVCVHLKEKCSRSQIEAWLRSISTKNSQGAAAHVLTCTEDPVVSSDFSRKSVVSVTDLCSLEILENVGFRILLWSNNEIGYARNVVSCIREWQNVRVISD